MTWHDRSVWSLGWHFLLTLHFWAAGQPVLHIAVKPWSPKRAFCFPPCLLGATCSVFLSFSKFLVGVELCGNGSERFQSAFHSGWFCVYPVVAVSVAVAMNLSALSGRYIVCASIICACFSGDLRMKIGKNLLQGWGNPTEI